MALADVITKTKQYNSIIKLISRSFGSEEEVLPLHEGDWLRASGLGELCPRSEVLRSRNNVVSLRKLSPDTLLTFLHGTALHWALQNGVLPKVCSFWGRWSCLLCGAVYGGPDTDEMFLDGAARANLVERPEHCERCCGSEFLYREIWFADKGMRVRGHPDGFLQLAGLDGLGVFEGKSIGDRYFWEVKNVPRMEHVIQLQTYLWLTGLKWGKILYWNKGGSGTAAFKEHLVERDEAAILQIKHLVNSIWRGIGNGLIPDRVCKTRGCSRATTCDVVELCFSDTVVRTDDHPF